jgi:hypothetical protein
LAGVRPRVARYGDEEKIFVTAPVTVAGNRREENAMIDKRFPISRTHFTEAEFTTLQSLRTRYQAGQHVFTKRELAHLGFLRWLVHSPGWRRAMDQPAEAQERQITTPRSPIWTLGSFA